MPIHSLLLMNWCSSNLHLQNATHSNLKILIILPKLSRVKGLWRLGRPCHRDLVFSYHLGLSRWVWTALLIFSRKKPSIEQPAWQTEASGNMLLLLWCTPQLVKYDPGWWPWDGIVLSPEISWDLNSLPASSSWTFWDFREQGDLQPVCFIQEGKCR